MDENKAFINGFLDNFDAVNPGEPVFRQAVALSLEAVAPYILDHPSVEDQNVMDRLTEPELAASFRVVWTDDEGEPRVNRGFFVKMNSALGKCRGRLRFHSGVNMDVIKYMAYEQTFANALAGTVAGGCAAGSDFSVRGKSDTEVMNFCQSFVTELQKYCGSSELTAEVGVSEREAGFIFGQMRRLKGEDAVRPSTLDVDACVVPEGLSGKTVALSGSGKTAQYVASELVASGARVVAMSDSEGFIYDRAGMDEAKLAYVAELKNVFHGSLKRYVEKYPQAEYFKGEHPWSVKCDAAIACACQNEINADEAKKLLKNGCTLVEELSGMSSSAEASAVFAASGIAYMSSCLGGEKCVGAFSRIADAMLSQGLV